MYRYPKDGIMDQEGIPAEILLNPQTKYVKDFVEDKDTYNGQA